MEENIADADIFLALTNDDEANIMSSLPGQRLSEQIRPLLWHYSTTRRHSRSSHNGNSNSNSRNNYKLPQIHSRGKMAATRPDTLHQTIPFRVPILNSSINSPNKLNSSISNLNKLNSPSYLRRLLREWVTIIHSRAWGQDNNSSNINRRSPLLIRL